MARFATDFRGGFASFVADGVEFRAVAVSGGASGSVNTLVVFGEVQYALGELAEARHVFSDVSNLSKASLSAHYYLAKIAFDLGELSKAKDEALEALKVNPLHAASYIILAYIASSQNRLDEALNLYETAGRLARFGTKNFAAQAFFRLGTLQEVSGKKPEAQKSFRLAWNFNSKIDPSLSKKVSGLDISSKALSSLVADEVYDSAYFQTQGESLVEQNKIAEGIRFYQAAQLLDPKNSSLLSKLGELTEKVATSFEEFRRAMNLYQRAIENNPKDPQGYVKLAILETEQYNFLI